MTQGTMVSILVTIRHPHHSADLGVRSGSGKNCHVGNTHRTESLLDSGPGTKWSHCADDPDYRPDPGVRSPKSRFTGFWRLAEVCTL